MTIAGIGPESIAYKVFRPGLTIHETRFAIGETEAHLEYLLKVDLLGSEDYK